jgi:hypothetical protein
MKYILFGNVYAPGIEIREPEESREEDRESRLTALVIMSF